MITVEEARQIVEQALDDSDIVILDDETIETALGWCFFYNSRAFVETGEFEDRLIGNGPYFVNRKTGSLFVFPTCYSVEESLARYHAGFRYEAYDLTISQVNDLERTVELLSDLRMTFVTPEVAHGEVWKVPQGYSKTQLREMLGSLPCVFRNQGFFIRAEVFEMIDEAACCEYEISEHVEE